MFIAALREAPPVFPPALRVKRAQGAGGIWEITFAPRRRDLRGQRAGHPERGPRHLATNRDARVLSDQYAEHPALQVRVPKYVPNSAILTCAN
jgi:hypothetical protein